MKDIAERLGDKMFEFHRESAKEIPKGTGMNDLFLEDSKDMISYELWDKRFKSILEDNVLPHKSILRRLMLQKNKVLDERKFDFKPVTLEFKKDIQIENMTNEYIGFGLFDQIKICSKDEDIWFLLKKCG